MTDTTQPPMWRDPAPDAAAPACQPFTTHTIGRAPNPPTVGADLTARVSELREIVGRMTPGEWRSERRLRESVVLQSGGKQDGYANRVVCLPQWSPAPYPQPTPDDAFANAAGIVALRNTALPIIDALVAERDALDKQGHGALDLLELANARIVELEGALRQIATNGWRDQSRAKTVARAALEGPQS
jgi:hypothetical protein